MSHGYDNVLVPHVNPDTGYNKIHLGVTETFSDTNHSSLTQNNTVSQSSKIG